jgi:hypothetical protein
VGVEVVANRIDSLAVSFTRLPAPPLVDLGGQIGVANQEFSGLVFPVLLSDGRIAVANGGTQEVRVFDANGDFRRPVGRVGDGPGEFRSLGWIAISLGDTIQTYDWSSRRLSVFTPAGAFARSTHLNPPSEETGLRPLGLLPDGRLLARTQPVVNVKSKGGVIRDSVAIILLDYGGEVVGTAGLYPGNEDWIDRGEKSVSASDRPFGKHLHVVPCGIRICVGTADAPEVFVLNTAGKVERIVRWTSNTNLVTAADIEEYMRAAGEGWDAGSERMRDAYLVRLRSAPFPKEKPRFAGLLAQPDGSLWVQRYGRSPHVAPLIFDVFDPAGAWLRTVEMPGGFVPTHISRDRVVGVWKDADDISHVRVYGLASNR